MTIAAKCPACGKDYDLAERFAGKKIRCTGCGETFGVGSAGSHPAAAATAAPKPATATTLEAVSKASDETVEISAAKSAAASAARRTRSSSGSGSGEVRLPPKRGGEPAAPPIVRAVTPAPPVRAVEPDNPSVVQPAGPMIATHEPAGAAHRVVGRRSRGGGGGLIVAGVVGVGVAATLGILFALGVFDGAGDDNGSTAAEGDSAKSGNAAADRTGNADGTSGGGQTPGKTNDPAGASNANGAGNDEAEVGGGQDDPPTLPNGGGPMGEQPTNDSAGGTNPGVEAIAPIPAAGAPPNSGKQGGFSFKVRGQPIALHEIESVIVPKEPRLDVIEPEEITGPKLSDGDEFEITCIQKQAFLGFVKTAEGKKPGKLSRDDIEFGDEATYLVEDEDSVLELQNRSVELTRGENHGVTELSVVASSLLEDRHAKFVADLPYLAKASFLDSKLTNGGAAHLASLTNLEFLSFSGSSGIDDEALPHFKHLTRLQELRLDGTKVSDAGLGHLAAMPWLKRLVLSNTDVSEDGAKRLRAALKTTEVVR